MPDDLKPVIVTTPSTSGTGGSGPVIPAGTPLILHVVRPLTVIVVRVTKAYLEALLGFLGGTTVVPALMPQFDIMPTADFGDRLQAAAALAVGAAGVSLLRNLVELFTKLDQKYPTLTV